MTETICSSVNLDLRMRPPFRRASRSRNQWSEIPGAGQGQLLSFGHINLKMTPGTAEFER